MNLLSWLGRKVDWEDLFQGIGQWWPIVVVFLGAATNAAALYLDIQLENRMKWWEYGALSGVILFALGIGFALIIKKYAIRPRKPDFKTIDSLHEHEIIDNKGSRAKVRQILKKVKVNKDMPEYFTYYRRGKLSTTGKIVGNTPRVYEYGNESNEYECWYTFAEGRELLEIDIRKSMKKGDLIENLCVEYTISEGFTLAPTYFERAEVAGEPWQKHLSIRFILPKGTKLIGDQGEWYKRDRRDDTRGAGYVKPSYYSDGHLEIYQDFSSHLEDTQIKMVLGFRADIGSNS